MDNDTDKAYFCFEKAVKDGWTELVNNWEQIKEVELERGNNKVVSIYSSHGEEILV